LPKVSNVEVRHVALLARLRLNEEEEELYAEQLNSILDYMQTLNEIETSGVEPRAHVVDLINVWREDKTKKGLGLEEVAKNAPDWENSMFRVPKIKA